MMKTTDKEDNNWEVINVFPGGAVIKNLPANAEMQETRVWSLGWEDALEEMATHSIILPRRIPWTEEPGGLQYLELLSARCVRAHTHTHNVLRWAGNQNKNI